MFGKQPMKGGAVPGGVDPAGPVGPAPDDTVLGVLRSMPARCRRSNLTALDDTAGTSTYVVVACHSIICLGHVLYLAFRSQGERIYNDTGGTLAGLITWVYVTAALVGQKKLLRVHNEILDYCQSIEIDADPSMKPMPKKLRVLWVVQTVSVMTVWAFYTVCPFIVELLRGLPLGSLRRCDRIANPCAAPSVQTPHS